MTGTKTSDTGVHSAMLKALYEVVSRAGVNMSETSRNSVLGLIDSGPSNIDGTHLPKRFREMCLTIA